MCGDWYVFCARFLNKVVMPSVLEIVELGINSFKWLTHGTTYPVHKAFSVWKSLGLRLHEYCSSSLCLILWHSNDYRYLFAG